MDYDDEPIIISVTHVAHYSDVVPGVAVPVHVKSEDSMPHSEGVAATCPCMCCQTCFFCTCKANDTSWGIHPRLPLLWTRLHLLWRLLGCMLCDQGVWVCVCGVKSMIFFARLVTSVND